MKLKIYLISLLLCVLYRKGFDRIRSSENDYFESEFCDKLQTFTILRNPMTDKHFVVLMALFV